MSEETTLKVGAQAPAFTLPDQDGNKIKLSDFKGQWVIFYAYPKDNTPGCSIEAKDFSDMIKKFEESNAVILGISADSVASHKKFVDKKELKITLVSDEEKTTLKKYGIWKPKKFMGREFLGVVRATFIISPEGKIAASWPKVKVKGHAEEVLATLKELHK